MINKSQLNLGTSVYAIQKASLTLGVAAVAMGAAFAVPVISANPALAQVTIADGENETDPNGDSTLTDALATDGTTNDNLAYADDNTSVGFTFTGNANDVVIGVNGNGNSIDITGVEGNDDDFTFTIGSGAGDAAAKVTLLGGIEDPSANGDNFNFTFDSNGASELILGDASTDSFDLRAGQVTFGNTGDVLTVNGDLTSTLGAGTIDFDNKANAKVILADGGVIENTNGTAVAIEGDDNAVLGAGSGAGVVEVSAVTGTATGATITGDIVDLGDLNILNGADLTLAGDDIEIDDTTFTGATSGTLNYTAQAATDIDGDITASTSGVGDIVFNSAGNTVTYTLTGEVGDANTALNSVTVSVGDILLLDSAVAAPVFNFGELTLANTASELDVSTTNAATIYGDIVAGTADQGILDLDTSTTFKGTIGAANSALLTLEAATGAVATFEDNAFIGTAELTATGEAAFTVDGKSFTGDIVGSADGNGVVDVDANTTVTGDLGGAGTGLETVNVADGKTLTLDGDIDMATANSAIVLDGGTLRLTKAAGAAVSLDNTDLDGSANGGVLDIDTDTTITGANTARIGNANQVAIDVASGKTLTSAGTLVFSDAATTLNGGTLNLDTDGDNYTGTIDSGTAGGTLDVDGSVTVTGNVGNTKTLSATTIADNETLTIGDAAAGDSVFKSTNITLEDAGNGSTLAVANTGDTTTITGALKTGTTDTGTFDIDTDTVFVGTVGETGKLLASVDVAATTTYTQRGNLFATEVRFNAADSELDVDTAGSTFTTDLVANADGDGIFDVNENVTIVGNLGAGGGDGLDSIDVASGKTLTIGNGGTVTTYDLHTNNGATINGTLNVNDEVELEGDLDFAANSTLQLATKTGSNPYAAANNVLYIDADQHTGTVDFVGATTLVLPANFTSGTVTVVDADGAGTVANFANLTTQSNVLADYTTTATAAGVSVTASAKSATTIGNDLGVSSGQAGGLIQSVTATAEAGDTEAAAALTTALAAGGQTAADAAEQVTPDINSIVAGATNAGVGASTANFGNISTQLASVRSGTSYADASGAASGLAAGQAFTNNSVWARGFFSTADQDSRDNQAGYESDTYGLTVGVDTEVAQDTRLGVALGYGATDVEGESAAQNDTEIDSYQLTLYGDYSPNPWYVEGMLAYAYNDVDTSSVINFGGLNRTLSGDYESNQYAASVGAGYEYPLNASVSLVPNAGLQYVHVEGETVQLTGANGFNQTVDIDDTDVFLGRIGARLEGQYDLTGGDKLMPEVHMNLSYDFASDDAEATSTFTGGGAAYNIEGPDTADFGFNPGLSFVYQTNNGMTELSAGYDANFKEDYQSHSGMIQARFKF